MLQLSYCRTASGLLQVSSQPAQPSSETGRKNQRGWGCSPCVLFFFLGVSKVWVTTAGLHEGGSGRRLPF